LRHRASRPGEGGASAGPGAPASQRGARRKNVSAASAADALLAGFPPILDAGIETLILGSFPGVASLAAGHYYAHPRNRFWPILERCLAEPLTALDFDARYRLLLRHRIGLWDVIDACVRPGSLDADIRDARPNALEEVLTRAPRLRKVLFNGQTAARQSKRVEQAGWRVFVLPSTSPAHAGMSFERKLEAWSTALSA